MDLVHPLPQRDDDRTGTSPVSPCRPEQPAYILVTDEEGQVERIRISSVDTAETVKDCLRSLFGLYTGDIVLRSLYDGVAVPLGPSLAFCTDPSEPPEYRLLHLHREMSMAHQRMSHASPAGGGFDAAAAARSRQQSMHGSFRETGDRRRRGSARGSAGLARVERMPPAHCEPPPVPRRATLERPSAMGARNSGGRGSIEIVPPDGQLPRRKVGKSLTIEFKDQAEVIASLDAPRVPSVTSPSRPTDFCPEVIPGAVSVVPMPTMGSPPRLVAEEPEVTTFLSEQQLSGTKSPPNEPAAAEVDKKECPSKKRAHGAVSRQPGKFEQLSAVESEYEFWARVAECGVNKDAGFVGHMKTVQSKKSMAKTAPQILGLTHYDTSAQRIDALYVAWAGPGNPLELADLSTGLSADCGLDLCEEGLLEALERIGSRFEQKDDDDVAVVPRIVFASLWQRLMLGACSIEKVVPNGLEDGIFVVEYSGRGDPAEKTESQRAFMYGGGMRNKKKPAALEAITVGSLPTPTTNISMTRWAWIEWADEQLIKLLGVKFFLHPLAVEDMVAASRGAYTKIDRYRHQYFVALEIYGIDSSEPDDIEFDLACSDTHFKRFKNPERVGPRVSRSLVSMVATGNPPTRAKISNNRDWLITVVNDTTQTRKAVDPLDRFSSNQSAANMVLEKVRTDLWSQKRQREYQADFLLYSIVEKAAHGFTPIYRAYGVRLRWLQDSLEAGTLRAEKRYVEEVSKVRLELQELQQWIAQLRVIIQHMEYDYQQDQIMETGDQATLGFGFGSGSDSKKTGQSIVVFLRHTKDYLEQADDKIHVLDDLARTFLADTERLKSDFMNQTLFLLTVATAVFLPAQFMASVYGMNFYIPELAWKHGYYMFMGFAVLCVVGGPTVMMLCYRYRGCLSMRTLRQCYNRLWTRLRMQCSRQKKKRKKKEKADLESGVPGGE
eukprot:TRINITY_DN3836_c0_g2_i1.p1 TRINITY_DN3836_c0_g2~~TRINITY_DN3836_c0_g2_i1.p1  ORF type:complete len:948 (+),score=172.12 TRINITY_DN3836_c0_g2_i1:196-3039(+)